MSKEFEEALEIYLDKRIKDIKNYLEFNERSEDEEFFTPSEELQICYLAKRMLAIDNAKPSEALEGLKHIKKYYVPQPCSAKTYDYLEIIEQSLLKAQEQAKVLKIVIEKRVDLESFCKIFVDNDYYSYNYYVETWGMYGACKLIEEEFNTVEKYAKLVAKE